MPRGVPSGKGPLRKIDAENLVRFGSGAGKEISNAVAIEAILHYGLRKCVDILLNQHDFLGTLRLIDNQGLHRRIGSVALTLIKMADDRLGATEEIQTAEGLTAVYSSRARTLVDAVYDWSRFNSLPRAYHWIRGELAAERVTASELVSLTLRYGDKGTIRRMGALLEREGVAGRLLKKLEQALSPSSSLIPWIPTYPKRGTVNR